MWDGQTQRVKRCLVHVKTPKFHALEASQADSEIDTQIRCSTRLFFASAIASEPHRTTGATAHTHAPVAYTGASAPCPWLPAEIPNTHTRIAHGPLPGARSRPVVLLNHHAGIPYSPRHGLRQSSVGKAAEGRKLNASTRPAE